MSRLLIICGRSLRPDAAKLFNNLKVRESFSRFICQLADRFTTSRDHSPFTIHGATDLWGGKKKSPQVERLAVIILKLINSRSDGNKSLLHLKCENWAQSSLKIGVPYLLPPFDNVFLLLDS